jgi:transposase
MLSIFIGLDWLKKGEYINMPIPFKNDPIEFNQRLLFPSNVFDLLPNDHECFVYDGIFRHLDTSTVEKKYSRLGQNAYHPGLIVGILIYAYSNGVFSSRQIEKKCHEDLGFMYVSHLNCPNFRVLSDFRKDNPEFLKESFKQSALMAKELGMVSLGHVSLDGSKFKANTSKHKAMSYEYLMLREKELVSQIDGLIEQAEQRDQAEDAQYQDKTGCEIPEELKIKEKRLAKIRAAKEALEKREKALHPEHNIDEKKQISFADKEARIMGKKGQYEYAYNGQISVDQESQIIVGQHLTQNANDKKEVGLALEEIQETVTELPEKMSFDNGYMSGSNLEELEGAEVDAYIATGREEKKDLRSIEECNREIKKCDFSYDSQRDCFTCPGGHTLELRRKGEDGKRVYQANREACEGCPYRDRCCKSKKSEPRTIHTDDKEPLRQQMIEKMEQEASKEIYKKRKEIVEPVFGQIKNGGFRGFLLRGFRKASGEFSLVCAVHNFKKIARAVLSGKVCLGAREIGLAVA